MQFDHSEEMAKVRRASATEAKLRSMDVYDIVEWVHLLEDQITKLERRNA